MRINLTIALLLLAFTINAQVPTNGLVAYYPFNENSKDLSGYGNDGINNGALPTSDRFGKANSAYSFNGSNSNISATVGSILYSEENTISLWATIEGPGTQNPRIVGVGPAGTPGQYYSLILDGTNNPRSLQYYSGGGIGLNLLSNSKVSNGITWYHYVVTFKDNVAKFYINGNYDSQVAGGRGLLSFTNAILQIGYSEGGTDWFDGKMDDIRIYNRALSGQEVNQLYQAEVPPVDINAGLIAYYPFNGNANDESGNNLNGIVNGASLTADRFGRIDKAYSFDGVSKRITIADAPQLNFSSSFSISYWLKTYSWGSIFTGGIISKKASDLANGYVIYNDGFHPDKINVRLQGQTYYPSASSVEINNWHQWAVTYDAQTSLIKIFKDGVLDITYNNNVGDLTSSANLYLGYAETWNQYLNGALDDIRFYNKAISDQEVKQLYQAEVPPADITTGLVAHYPFDGNANDVSGNRNHGTPNGVSLTTDRIGNLSKAYSFDGATNTIEISKNSNVTGSNPRSVSAWVKLDPSATADNTIYKGGTNGDGNDFTFLVRIVSDNQIQLYIRRFINDVWSENITITSGEWFYATATFDGTTTSGIKFYFNGKLKATVNGGTSTFNTTATNPTIGDHISQQGFHSYFKGDIDELSVYNKALNQFDIQQIYMGGSTTCSFTTPQIYSSQIPASTTGSGLLELNINVKACPENVNIYTFSYWFDGVETNTKSITTTPLNYLNFTTTINCEALAEGIHSLHYKFKDANGNFSETVSKMFTRAAMTVKQITSPAISTARGTVNVGDLQKIKGVNFTPGGEVKVIVKNANNEIVDVISPVTYLANGAFTINFNIENGFIDGEYKASAIDVTTGISSSEIVFFVNNPVNYTMVIERPTKASIFKTGERIAIIWRDFVSKENPYGISGSISKRYKIEITKDNGISWTTIRSNYMPEQLLGDALNNSISYITSIDNSGIYRYRISDSQNSTNNKVSESFEVVSETGEYRVSLNWDNSYPVNGLIPPVGLAADGVSRILVFLDRVTMPGTPREITKITATIRTLQGESSLSGISNLGKVMFTTKTDKYSLDGNKADKIYSDTIVTIQGNRYPLWLVAPDDYTTEQQDITDSRKIKLQFDITYKTGSPETFYSQDIEIVRPPLMWVHGLNGDEASFKNAKYLLNGATKSFFDGNSNPWKVNERVQLINYEGYDKNARILLGMDFYSREHPNTFKYFLDAMHQKRYAANRVDYVCHSMGGCIARTILNVPTYQNVYRPAEFSSEEFKNYDSGFINKLITINTPHNGSPIADYLYDNRLNPLLANVAFYLNPLLQLGFWHNVAVSNAILDLRSEPSNGIHFSETRGVKNHLIAADVAKGTYTTLWQKFEISNILRQNANNSSKGLMEIYKLTSNGLSYTFIESYNNTELWDDADIVVPLSSQLASPNRGIADDISEGLFTGNKARSIIYGDGRVSATQISAVTHTSITDNSYVGKRVFVLLNSAIASTRFDNSIAANPIGPTVGYRVSKNNTLKNPIQKLGADSSKFVINSPVRNAGYLVDSLLEVSVNLIDTVNFRKLQVIFQGEFYESDSKVPIQKFQVKANPSAIGNNTILVNAAYDSAGLRKDYFDTVTINVNTIDMLVGFSVSPGSSKLNKQHSFNIDYIAKYSNFIGNLNYNIDSLSYIIADTNVVVTDSVNQGFITKDTGSTYIIFDYKGFKDTAFVYISFADMATINSCPQGAITLNSRNEETGATYQWQVDEGAGFLNINDGVNYSGAIASNLSISNLPNNFSKNSYRCITTIDGYKSFSETYTIKIKATWNGTIDTSWTNVQNWDCNAIPDENVDVIIPTGKLNYPTVSTNVNVNSLKLEKGAKVTVAPSAMINVKSKQ